MSYLLNHHGEKGELLPQLKGRRRAKSHATKALAPFEATIAQLTNTVGNIHLVNSQCQSAQGTTKGQTSPPKTLRPFEALRPYLRFRHHTRVLFLDTVCGLSNQLNSAFLCGREQITAQVVGPRIYKRCLFWVQNGSLTPLFIASAEAKSH